MEREHTTDEPSIGERLRAARQANRLSVQQARDLLLTSHGESVTPQTWRNWESGRTRLPSSMIVTLSRLLSVPVGVLVGEAPNGG